MNQKVDFAPILTLEEFIVAQDILQTERKESNSIVLTSGGYDPIHPGHISCIVDSKNYGDTLVVVVNGDWFLDRKKGRHLMSLETRCEIVSAIRGVDYVIPFEIENDLTVNNALRAVRPDVFTKGGNKVNEDTIPEWDICQKEGIAIVTGVGDSKVHSSTNILEDWYEYRLRLFMPREESLDIRE